MIWTRVLPCLAPTSGADECGGLAAIIIVVTVVVAAVLATFAVRS